MVRSLLISLRGDECSVDISHPGGDFFKGGGIEVLAGLDVFDAVAEDWRVWLAGFEPAADQE
jgi:hypothetical protein